MEIPNYKGNLLCFLQVKSGDPCTDCKAFFGDVKMMLSNATTQVSLFSVNACFVALIFVYVASFEVI